MKAKLCRLAARMLTDVLIAVVVIVGWLAFAGLGVDVVTSGPVGTWASAVVAGAASIGLMRLCVHLLWSRGASNAGLHGCSRAAAMTEFIITFPVLLMLILGTMQLAWMFMAHAVVEYAAFQAVRRAIVTIPTAPDSGEEPEGCICVRRRGNSKVESIRSAAAQVTAAISPQIQDHTSFSRRRAPVDEALGEDEFSTGENLAERTASLALKFGYSTLATGVTLNDAETLEAPQQPQCGGGDVCFQYDRMDDVTVVVHYVFPLRIPLAAQLMGRPFAVDTANLFSFFESIVFRDGEVLSAAGVSMGALGAVSSFGPWRYIVIRAHATLPNEGA